MAIAPVDPNVQYARPLVISSEPVNNYLREREQQQRNALMGAKILSDQQIAQQKLNAQRQKDIEARMKYVSDLGKYDIGGPWQKEQESDIDTYQNTLTKMIQENNPNWQQYAIQAAGRLEGNRKKAAAYTDLMNTTMANYGKNKTLNMARFQPYWIGKTAYNDKGLIPLDQLNLQDVQNFNPMVQGDLDASGAVNDEALNHALATSFQNNVTTIGSTTRKDGVTTGATRTITAPNYMRINPINGSQSIDRVAVKKDPFLSNTFFDPYRSAVGDVSLVTDQTYGHMMQDPDFASAVARQINRMNVGKKPGDKNYLNPSGEDAVLIGKAMATGRLFNEQHGNFSLHTTHYENEKGNKPGTKDKYSVGLADRLDGWLRQDPTYLDNSQKLQTLPYKSLDQDQIKTANGPGMFKDFNVFEQVKTDQSGNEKKIPVPAEKVVIRKDEPDVIWFYPPGGGKPVGVKRSQMGEFVNSRAALNKNLDVMKFNQAWNAVNGQQEQQQEPEQKPEPPKKPNIIQRAKTTLNRWAGYKDNQ